MTHRILSIVGTRPEAIKMAPVIQALAARGDVTSRVCVSGQHREMMDPILSLFGIVPDVDLNVMRPGASLTEIVARVMSGTDGVIADFQPDWVLVQGDTSTAMAAALAAFNRKTPVAHIEAGLRTYDLAAPWPEELNRRVIDVAAQLLLAPTESARDNLLNEAVTGRILVTGNTVIDALHACVARLDGDRALRSRTDAGLPQLDPARRLILVTGHRRENFGEGLAELCAALTRLAARGDVEIVYPLHLNPNVCEPVRKRLGDKPGIHLIEPQDYVAFVRLMQRSHLIITDSGGVQEEAPALGKPVLVTRAETERTEGAQAGGCMLVGPRRARVVEAANRLLDDPGAYAAMARPASPYGDGHAAGRIVAALAGAAVEEFRAPAVLEPFPPRLRSRTQRNARRAAEP